MHNYRRNLRLPKRLTEIDEDEFIDDVEEVEDILNIDNTLMSIGNKLGYDYTSSNGSGSFSVSDNVEVRVRFTPDKVVKVQTVILKNPARFDCTRNTTTIDNLSVELQTCVLIIKEIKQKLM